VTGSWGGSGSSAQLRVAVPAGEGALNVSLSAQGVALWWPNGMGAQSLYSLQVSLQMDASAGESALTASRMIGFRTGYLVTGNDTDPNYVVSWGRFSVFFSVFSFVVRADAVFFAMYANAAANANMTKPLCIIGIWNK
jgi:hypothetical protein